MLLVRNTLTRQWAQQKADHDRSSVFGTAGRRRRLRPPFKKRALDLHTDAIRFHPFQISRVDSIHSTVLKVTLLISAIHLIELEPTIHHAAWLIPEETRMFFRKLLRCSFCGRDQTEVSKLVAGPQVYICDECASIVSRIIDGSYKPPNPPPSKLSKLLNSLRRAVRRREN